MRINLSTPYRRNYKQQAQLWPIKRWSTIFGIILLVYLVYWWLMVQGWSLLLSTATKHVDVSRRGDVFLLSHLQALTCTYFPQLFHEELRRLSVDEDIVRTASRETREQYVQTKEDDLLDMLDHILWIGPTTNHEAHSELSPSASISWPPSMSQANTHSQYELHIESLPPGSILVFDSFPTSVVNIAFDSIFQYFDDLLRFARYFRSLNKHLTLLWIMPKVSTFKATTGYDELQAIFQHLTIQHAINRLGIMVTDGTDLDHMKENVLDHVNMLHYFSRQHFGNFPHEYPALEKVSVSPAAAFQLRMKLVSLYLSTFYSEEGHAISANGQFKVKTLLSRDSDSLQAICGKLVNTRKFSAACFPSIGKRFSLLVTGLGGSGTHFIANSLQQLGFSMHHEDLGQQGAVVSMLRGCHDE
jgi:hypothetical protein